MTVKEHIAKAFTQNNVDIAVVQNAGMIDLSKAVKCAGSLTLFKNSLKLTFSVSNNITTNCIIYVYVLYVCTCMHSLSSLIIECNH